MNKVRKIALELFPYLDENIKCLCNGEHDICLQCIVCHAKKYEPVKIEIPQQPKDIAKYIDHTALKPDTRIQDIKRLCEQADKYHFASVCVNPIYVSYAKEFLQKSDNIAVCSVIGFPLSANRTETKLKELELSLQDGAEEIDMVINLGMLMSGKYQIVEQEIAEISKVCRDNNVILKVILENCLLNEDKKIIANLLAKKAGADFVKTSTGFSSGGAEVMDVELMRKIVGNYIGVKAAAGIRTFEKAKAMIQAGANRIGASASLNIIKRD